MDPESVDIFTDDFDEVPLVVILEDPGVAIPVGDEEMTRFLRDSDRCWFAEVLVIISRFEGSAENQVRLVLSFRKPHDLVKANIGDVDVSPSVNRDSMGQVEHSGAKFVEDLAAVRFQDQDWVLLDDLAIPQLVIAVKGLDRPFDRSTMENDWIVIGIHRDSSHLTNLQSMAPVVHQNRVGDVFLLENQVLFKVPL